MPSATRSGWTAARGHVPKPDLNVLDEAQQQTFYETQLLDPNGTINLKSFVKPSKLTMYSEAGNVSKERAERAFFSVNTIESEVFSNWGDKTLIDARTNPNLPVEDGFASMEDFSRRLQSRTVQKILLPRCGTYSPRPSLERWAKTSGELQTTLDGPTQQWLSNLGPTIRNFTFNSKPIPTSGALCTSELTLSTIYSLLPPYRQVPTCWKSGFYSFLAE